MPLHRGSHLSTSTSHRSSQRASQLSSSRTPGATQRSTASFAAGKGVSCDLTSSTIAACSSSERRCGARMLEISVTTTIIQDRLWFRYQLVAYRTSRVSKSSKAVLAKPMSNPWSYAHRQGAPLSFLLSSSSSRIASSTGILNTN